MGRLKESVPHLLMTIYSLTLAVFLVFLQSLLSGGDISPLVFLLYQHILSTILLSILAFFFERGKRPPITLTIFLWAFLVGFVQVPLGQLLLTISLGYISASFQTTVMNAGCAVTFLLAIIFRQEIFRFCTINGQAKLWGIIISVMGATVMVLWSGPRLGVASSLHDSSDIGNRVIGCLLVTGALLAIASSGLLVERVLIKYPAELSLSAMMCFCGTFQTTIIAVLTERNTSGWKINFHGSYEVPVILYGGIIVAGLSYYLQNWCIHKKGPVFTSAFGPLLVVFSFVLETVVLGKYAHLGSILGAIFVIVGVYLLLWAKADENQEEFNTNLPTGDYEQLS